MGMMPSCAKITSKNISDKYAVPVDDTDFRSGHLKQSSNIRPNRLPTADTLIMSAMKIMRRDA
jgi:mRNA interferase MazF